MITLDKVFVTTVSNLLGLIPEKKGGLVRLYFHRLKE